MSVRGLVPVALCALLAVAAAEAPRDPAGTWGGVLEAAGGGEETAISLELRRHADGSWTGTLDAGADPARLTAVTVAGDSVRFTAEALPGAPEFSGRLSADGLEIVGESTAAAPPPPPGADVWLAPIERQADGAGWRSGTPVNATDRDGYDNQPRFLADSTALLYTSIRDGQADVYRLEVETRTSARVTETVESEYSPTPLPTGDGFSTVRVEQDGTQRLWRFDFVGRRPRLVLTDVQPVGYHGWLDASRLGLFVLGSPPTLQLADVERQTAEVLTEQIGRSIHLTPDASAVSFVSKSDPDAWTIDIIDLESRRRRTLLATRPGSEDFVWTPDGRLLMAEGSELFVADPAAESASWTPVADLTPAGVRGITRLAVSPNFRWLAVVGERPAAERPSDSRVVRAFRLRRND